MIAIPTADAGVSYVDDWELAQFQSDHGYKMYHQYMEQFQQDQSEPHAINNNVFPFGFGSSEVVVIDMTDEEEDLEEDPEEEENIEESESSGDTNRLEYIQDLEEFNSWDDQSIVQDLVSVYVCLLYGFLFISTVVIVRFVR